MSETFQETAVVTPASWTHVLDLGQIFGAGKRIEVDVGSGKGRFVVSRAKAHPETHFLGIERSRSRVRKLDKRIIREKLPNVRLLCLEASYVIRYLLPPRSISVFHIFFPDPWPKRRHHRRRLFSESFTDSLFRTLEDGGQVNLATDHLDYLEQIRRWFRKYPGFAEVRAFVPVEEERTNFEILFMAKNTPIGRSSFRKEPPR